MAKNICFSIYLLLFNFNPGHAQSGHSGSTVIRNQVAATYNSQIGVRELTGNNDGKAVETYLHYCGLTKGDPWCASFVCWVYGQNHIANPRSGYCPDLFKRKHLIWRRSAKNTPKTRNW